MDVSSRVRGSRVEESPHASFMCCVNFIKINTNYSVISQFMRHVRISSQETHNLHKFTGPVKGIGRGTCYLTRVEYI